MPICCISVLMCFTKFSTSTDSTERCSDSSYSDLDDPNLLRFWSSANKTPNEWFPRVGSPTLAYTWIIWSTCWKTHYRASLQIFDSCLGWDSRIYISHLTQRWYWCYWSSNQTSKPLSRTSLEMGIGVLKREGYDMLYNPTKDKS